MPWPTEPSRRDMIKRYIRDMSVSIATSTHKDAVRQLGHADADRLIHEVATLAAFTALERYDTENRIIVEQADSFYQMTIDRESLRPPAAILGPVFAHIRAKACDQCP